MKRSEDDFLRDLAFEMVERIAEINRTPRTEKRAAVETLALIAARRVRDFDADTRSQLDGMPPVGLSRWFPAPRNKEAGPWLP